MADEPNIEKNKQSFHEKKSPSKWRGFYRALFIIIVQMSHNVEHRRNWNFACVEQDKHKAEWFDCDMLLALKVDHP